MVFQKQHLISDSYHWSPDANNKSVSGDPARRYFDKNNGEQILFIINCFGESIGKLSVNDGRRLEELILKELPSDMKSELAVFNWLKGKYLYYSNLAY
ncbi:MAG: hypothetical protein JWN76_2958 [Chitinophagaceae bacterium]|nr:hypothetical protein [Chitinophagaceae bacterium]